MNEERLRKFACTAAVLLSSIALFFAFPPFGKSVNAWSALVPLLWICRTSSPKTSAKCFFFAGMLFWLGTLCWFPAIIKNGGPWYLVLLGQIGLAAWCSLFWTAFAFLSASIWERYGGFRRIFLVLLADPILWCGMEFLRGWLLSGFAWNFLGVSQWGNLAILQTASIFGVYGVSALLIMVNGAIASICQRLAKPLFSPGNVRPPVLVRLRRSLESALPFAVVLVAWCWGNARLHSISDKKETWRVALVQPNIPCRFEWDENTISLQQERLLDPTKLISAAKPDLVLWPETAVIGSVPSDSFTLSVLRAGAAATDGALLAGVTEKEEFPGGPFWYNSAALVAKDGTTLGLYRKRHLVPFGEYIPGDKMLPILQRLAPTGISCHKGMDPSILTFAKDGRSLKIGSLICFEDTIPSLARSSANAGAQLLALLTNDAWFNNSCEPVQHLHQSIFRAVENGLPLVRSANSGVSCFVDAYGRLKCLELEGKKAGFNGFLLGEIETSQRDTFYRKAGDWPLLCAFAMLVLTGFMYRHKRGKA